MFAPHSNREMLRGCLRVTAKGVILTKKGTTKLTFHCYGRVSCPHLPLSNPPLDKTLHLVLQNCICIKLGSSIVIPFRNSFEIFFVPEMQDFARI